MYDYEEKFWKTINRFVDKNYELSGTNVVSKVTGEVLVTFKHTAITDILSNILY